MDAISGNAEIREYLETYQLPEGMDQEDCLMEVAAKFGYECTKEELKEAYAGKAEELLPRFVADGLRPDVIVIDPPRKGVEPPVIQAIAQAGPSRVVYVSCNPATLARDAKLLTESGYRVQKVQPVDMFCWTSGIETVCLFSR